MRKLTVVTRPVEELIPYARNARTHSETQVAQIAASIQEFGWTNPVLIDEAGGIIAGHGRVLGARRLKMAKVPCIVLSGLTEAQKRAYVLADNQLALNAGWNEELLKFELQDLRGQLDLSLIGFSTRQLESLIGEDAPVTEGETDPPYNVAYEGNAGSIQGDDQNEADFKLFLYQALNNCQKVMRPGACIYVAHADTARLVFTQSFLAAGLKLAQVLIWVKSSAVLSRQDYNWRHEPILYGWKEGSGHYFCGNFTKSTVLEQLDRLEELKKDELVALARELRQALTTTLHHDRPQKSELHPTMKPVALVRELMENSSVTGQTVLDPFGGSGTTLIAAEQLNRTARLMELDPKYVDVIVRRWQDFTGKSAVRVDEEGSFNELALKRKGVPVEARP